MTPILENRKAGGEDGKGELTHHEPVHHVKSQLKPEEASPVVPASSGTLALSPLTLPFTHLPSANCPSGLHPVTAAHLWPPVNKHYVTSTNRCARKRDDDDLQVATKYFFYSPRSRNYRDSVKHRAEYFHPEFNPALLLREDRTCMWVF